MTVGLVCALAGCKPATEQEKYERALGWTKVEDVRQHLDGGKDPNLVFPDGKRPVHVVAGSMHGKAEVLRLLIERGAQIDAKDGDGKTAWDLRWGDDKRKLGEDDAALLLAILDAGFVPPLATLDGGRTPLHQVARRVPSARLASEFITTLGFAVDARDDDGWTPLHVAVHDNNAQAATGLLQQGADANAETTKTVGKSSSKGNVEMVRWRYQAGSRPLDVRRRGGRGRFDEDARKVVEQYGGTSNDAVDNKPK